MTIETDEQRSYVNTFIAGRPKNGIDSPHARLLSALKVNEEFAEYFKDRAQVEDAYAKNIAKLSKKSYITNKLALGTFLPLWEALQSELTQLASIHNEYSTTIIEQIEQPLKTSILDNINYAEIHEVKNISTNENVQVLMLYKIKLDSHLQKIAREYDDLENKIQKHKKNVKGEGKVIEYTKQQEQKLAEWNRDAPGYLQKHQNVDEFRLENLKNAFSKFETIQRLCSEKIIELVENSMAVEPSLIVNDEIASFCASHNNSTVVTETQTDDNNQTNHSDNIFPEPSISNASLKVSNLASSSTSINKKDKKRFFSSLVSIRRKTKSNINKPPNENNTNFEKSSTRQRNYSNEGSIIGSSSLHSINTHGTSTEQHTNDIALNDKGLNDHNAGNYSSSTTMPGSPTSLNPPSIQKAPSFNGSFTNTHALQPPLILVDEEGYSIPPSDRSAWPGDTNTMSDSLIDTDDVGSDGGSLFSNQRIRVDIKSEAVKEEDASQSAVALTRVSTLLKERNTSGSSSRRLRGRREIRATQLYSVIEQDQPTSQIGESLHDSSSTELALFNPFQASHEKITEATEETPYINVHITETVHALSRGGIPEKSIVWGEVGLQYKGPRETAHLVCFKLNYNEKLESIETTKYIDILDGHTLDDKVFKINTQLFDDREEVKDPIVCVRYQAVLNGDRLPLTIKPIWKCDSDKSRLLVKYHKNTNISSMENVLLVTSITGNVQNALSIPAGELILSQNRIKWHIGQIKDGVAENESVIKAQFTTLEQASPKPIAARFEIKDQLLTDFTLGRGADPLIQWVEVCNMTKIIKAGKYVAEV
ncbi:MAG: Muniscin C-terminal mu homology domain-containing protein [Benjaminiella poitrasii]|nr:MAG: Muniscin C-terminal mu homology domain-containing protein [Benjaminiella poitrasii]